MLYVVVKPCSHRIHPVNSQSIDQAEVQSIRDMTPKAQFKLPVE